MKIDKLAIVIPAYKPEFFREALRSIEKQTRKRFHVYVGDDCSPHDLSSIVESFSDKLPITYVRFSENLGGSNLVRQWARCIELVQDEEWIWLFSDDDEMGVDCVSSFYDALNCSMRSADLFRFDLEIIDRDGATIQEVKPSPDWVTCSEYFKNRAGSFAVEFIFRKSTYYSSGGFVEFDLAWGSDHATWIKLAYPGGIRNINGPKVRWRSSGINISTMNEDPKICLRKIDAELRFHEWAVNFFEERGLPFPVPAWESVLSFFGNFRTYTSSISVRDCAQVISRYAKLRKSYTVFILGMLYVLSHKSYRSLFTRNRFK